MPSDMTLLPDLPVRVRDKARKRLALAQRALDSLERFRPRLQGEATPAPRAATTV